jgi:hypothetical protein
VSTVSRRDTREGLAEPALWKEHVISTADARRWTSWIEAISDRVVFSTLEYVSVLEQSTGNKAQLYFYGDHEDYIVYAFFLRSLADLPFLRSLNGRSDPPGTYDIESPYGYSGPLAHLVHPEVAPDLWKGFLRQFHRFCVEHSIVSEFARLNPFIRNYEPLALYGAGVRRSGEVVYVDLSQPEAQLWRQLNRGNKSKIHHAQRSGVTIVHGNSDADLDGFSTLYSRTMERRDAASWYRFGDEFVFRLRARLGDRLQQFTAKVGEQPIAAALFIYASDVLHYFLGGSDERYLSLRPNNLLMFEAIRWAKANGFRLVNLGGGYQPGDSLLQFKLSFSKSTLPFYTYTATHMTDAYDELCGLRAKNDATRGRREPPTDFFPAYRVR